MDDPTQTRSYADAAHEQTVNRIASVTAGLRHIADEIDREAKVGFERLTEPDLMGRPRGHVDVIRDALHTLHWGIANLNMDSALDFAMAADAAALEGSTEPPR